MSNPVLVFIDHDRGAVGDDTRQAFAFARACLPDAAVAAVVIGGDTTPAVTGADTIWHVRHAELDDYAPEAWGDALHQLAAEVTPSAIVTTGTERGNEVLAHVAAIADEPFAANVVAATPGAPWQIRRARWGGSLLEDATLTAVLPILSCALHAYPSDPSTTSTTSTTSNPNVAEFVPVLQPDAGRTRIVDRVQVAEGITLTTAPVVVSGGRGVGSEEGFAAIEALAELLGGAVGCSRVVTNQGWRPHADQVGQTGKRVAPDLYIACGISGAIQHWVGMQAAKQILAINLDRDAPMVTKADYAVIGDLHEVIPAIVDEIRRRRAAT
ncbi:MAG: electron transfer flavoprotein subunit alpha/FixB family protein [Actinomycetia bacterium]|nr:electron transfer flavoprotein subunit alpha/FixB family protein [Actinomycetes bacterium]